MIKTAICGNNFYTKNKSALAPFPDRISDESPALDFSNSQWLDLNQKDFMLFKRRLSQISRMTIQVLHDIMPLGEKTKIVFVSFRGEIHQQFKINSMLINEGSISPAAFSQSVFNTPAVKPRWFTLMNFPLLSMAKTPKDLKKNLWLLRRCFLQRDRGFPFLPNMNPLKALLLYLNTCIKLNHKT